MTQYYTNERADDGLRKYIAGVYSTMGVGLLITAAMAYYCFIDIVNGGFFFRLCFTGMGPLLLAFIQLGVALYLGTRINHMSVSKARITFFLYCVLTGITFGTVPLAYGVGAVFQAFVYAAVMFFSCAVIGYTTRVDLTRFSGLLFGGLISLLVCQVFGMIFGWGNSLFVGGLGIIIFMGMTAWDMQNIRKAYYYSGSYEQSSKYAVISALNLYLDFVNIFLYVLRFIGMNDND